DTASRSTAAIAPESEPGDRLVVSGTVREGNGRPVEGALVYAFQTDALGLYSASGMDETNPRLFPYVKTDAAGKFELRTIRPGHYKDTSPPVEEHVHIEVEAPGFRTERHRLGFADDPVWAQRGTAPPDWAVPVTRESDGVERCAVEVAI